jgi:hypothetical protein
MSAMLDITVWLENIKNLLSRARNVTLQSVFKETAHEVSEVSQSVSELVSQLN